MSIDSPINKPGIPASSTDSTSKYTPSLRVGKQAGIALDVSHVADCIEKYSAALIGVREKPFFEVR
jgi:hypothetical protein